MTAFKLPLDRRWIEQELKQYLRCAFSHEMTYDQDLNPVICRAIAFTFKKTVSSSQSASCEREAYMYRTTQPMATILCLNAFARLFSFETWI
jgi:hypothetical protein